MSKKADKQPHPLDVAVGERVRFRRKMLGLSQSDLAHGVGVAFQQIQKYERGTNRICISRLAQMSETLRCSLLDLIGDLDTNDAVHEKDTLMAEPLDPQTKELISVFASLGSGEGRLAILELARHLALVQQSIAVTADQDDVAVFT
ncbi:MAG TPA: helix-turn-helix domain-containing protein [Rhizomicrobium sp.]|nr:helix-turn-helix domain-containing protein [Rhizomicrobium sp.]